MQHLGIFPILIPLLFGALLLLPPISKSLTRLRVVSIIATLFTLASSTFLLIHVYQQGTQLYTLGNWQPPFGIVLVADLLSSLLVLLTSILAFSIMLYAVAGEDSKGRYFHPLFLFQIMGINGAFLTGDIFNLFVFFEVLLIASYSLLIHGGGKQKTQAALHYVILNLVGSSLFLFGLGILYGTFGTLNMADMAAKAASLQGGNATLAKIGGLLLLIVFGLKAAMLPLHFWLPKTYSSASAPVSAIFAVMTKVGIYSILRVYSVVFSSHAGELANLATPWLWPLALATLFIGTIGILASPTLKILCANLIIVSSGTLLICIAIGSVSATAAALYYMIHSTLASAGLFLLAGVIAKQRGQAQDRFVSARPLQQPIRLGIAFSICALALIGMPPLSGFIGKVMILQITSTLAPSLWIWPLILLSSLAALVVFSRAGTTLFWRSAGNTKGADSTAVPPLEMAAITLLLLASPLLSLFGGPISEITQQAAQHLHDTQLSVYRLLPGA